ncbi:MAG: winged helix-turn-helix transcriptional regulator, partial [Promethearchaeota archaeon]
MNSPNIASPASSVELNSSLKEQNKRILSIVQNPKKFSILSIRNDKKQHDKLKLDILSNLPNGFQITLSYKAKSGGSSDENYDYNFDIFFLNLIEYTDTDNNDIYEDNGSDLILQEIALKNFLPLNYSIFTIDGKVNVYEINIGSIDGIFKLHLYFAENFIEIDHQIISPIQAKMDVEITNFPFQTNNSRFALQMQLTNSHGKSGETLPFSEYNSTEDEKNNFTTNESGIKADGSQKSVQNYGYFTWLNNAKNGFNDSIAVKGFFNPQTSDLYLNYPQNQIILHDPKIGYSNLLIISPTNGISEFFNNFSIIQWILIGCGGIALIFGLLITNQNFRSYLLNRNMRIDSGVHHLSMTQILENEIRSQIIDIILNDPGIHYSELLRQVQTSASNLAWHIDILETYKIIRKQRIGNYLIFFPYFTKNPFIHLDPKIAKSKTTLQIFQLICENPGIFQNQIARRLILNRKSVKYHIDKLLEANLIQMTRSGRKT